MVYSGFYHNTGSFPGRCTFGAVKYGFAEINSACGTAKFGFAELNSACGTAKFAFGERNCASAVMVRIRLKPDSINAPAAS